MIPFNFSVEKKDDKTKGEEGEEEESKNDETGIGNCVNIFSFRDRLFCHFLKVVTNQKKKF